MNDEENKTSKPLRRSFHLQLTPPVAAFMMRYFVCTAPEPWMLRNRDDYPSARLRSRAHSAQDRFVIRNVFNHIKRASEIEGAHGRNVACIHLHELYFRRQTAPSTPGLRRLAIVRTLPIASANGGDRFLATSQTGGNKNDHPSTAAAIDFKEPSISACRLAVGPTVGHRR